MELYDALKALVKPELFILVPVIYIIGNVLKKGIRNTGRIPVILGTISIGFSSLYIFATEPVSDIRNVMLAVFLSLTQGILIAGASVYSHQVYKQSIRGKGDGNEKC